MLNKNRVIAPFLKIVGQESEYPLCKIIAFQKIIPVNIEKWILIHNHVCISNSAGTSLERVRRVTASAPAEIWQRVRRTRPEDSVDYTN